MRNLILGVACILSVSMSVTMSAQADINDFINAQVSGTSIYIEYSHQMMLDSIDAQNLLLGSVTAPAITSGATGTDLPENSGAGQPVYTTAATAVWPAPTYAIAGADAALLGVDASTGVVSLTANPDYETQVNYSFTVTADDAAGNVSNATTVTFSITNVDEDIPTITSGAAGTDLAENSGAGLTIYTITADANDGGTIQSYAIAGTDASLLTLTGNVVTLTADPDYDTKSSYIFTVTATDEAGTSAATTVTFAISEVVAPPQVGDFYGGGVVYYIFESGDIGYVAGETHGLIAAVEDQGVGVAWQANGVAGPGYYVETGATATAIGTGSTNTTTIIGFLEDLGELPYAAGIARAYNGGGLNDWFLPSKIELNKMRANTGTINTTAAANGGGDFEIANYWSSSESSLDMAVLKSFYNSNESPVYFKSSGYHVRAARAF